jgi:3-hydroxybutyryl-CoA dehydrogenase
MVDRKELGTRTGKGFYTYPDPEFTRPDFLEG